MTFKVVISTMVEAGKPLYFVRVIHPNRPEDAKPWDDGYMDVFSTHIEEHAEAEKESWEHFFNYSQDQELRLIKVGEEK